MADITLVDDDENIVTSVSLALESHGHQVKAYYDGASGLAALEANPPDLAILDVKINDPLLQPNGNPAVSRGFSSTHTGGVHFLLGDGRVQFVNENIDFNNVQPAQQKPNNTLGLFQRLGRRNDGLTIGEF